MKNASDSGSAKYETPEEIVEHISRLMSEAEALLVDSATQVGGEKLADMKARLASAQAKLGDLYGSVRRKVTDSVRSTDETIRSHPYESLAIALGVGVLLGALVRRSGS